VAQQGKLPIAIPYEGDIHTFGEALEIFKDSVNIVDVSGIDPPPWREELF